MVHIKIQPDKEMNSTSSNRLFTFFYSLAASFIFIIIAISLYYKTPHGVIRIYSIDRIFYGLGALNPDQFLRYAMIFSGYWSMVTAYTILMKYILRLDLKRSIFFAILMGIYVHITLSLFDLAAQNKDWSLSFSTYYDPVFIYITLVIYVFVLFTINIFISRSVIFSAIDYIKYEKEDSLIPYWIIFFLPVVILTGYSFVQLRFYRMILFLVIGILFYDLIIAQWEQKFSLVKSFIRPIYKALQNEKIFLGTVGLFTLLIRIVFSLSNQNGIGADDSPYYSDLGWRLASGENVKDLFFPPGYWMYLGTFYKIFGKNHLLLMVLQSFIGSSLPFLIYAISKEIFNVKVARLSAILVSINSSIIFYSTVIATESIYTPLTLLSLWLLLKARNSDNKWFFISTGILIGLSVIIKPVILAFPLVILVWMFLTYRHKVWFIVASWVLLIIMVLIIIAPITYRNNINHQRFILLTEYKQVEQTLINPQLKEAGIYGDSYGKMLKNIITNPVKFSIAFIKGAPSQLLGLFWGRKVYVPFDAVYIHNGSPYAFNLKVYFTLISLLGIFASIFIEKGFWRERLLPLFLITYYCIMYIFFYGKIRYAMPMLPLTIMFGAFGFYYLSDKFKPLFDPVNSYKNNRQQKLVRGFKMGFSGVIGSIVLTLFGLNYAYNSHAGHLLKDGRELLKRGDYAQARDILRDVNKKYPDSQAAQSGYRDLILSGARNIDLSMDILNDYFISYKGLLYTIETFEDLIDVFKTMDKNYLGRIKSYSDISQFMQILDFQERVILNVSYNYPYADQVIEMTCQSLYYLQNMRGQAGLKIAENYLKDRMPQLAEKEFKDMLNMPERIVFRQWFVEPACRFATKGKLHKTFGTLYFKYGFRDYAIKEFEMHLENHPDDMSLEQYGIQHGRR